MTGLINEDLCGLLRITFVTVFRIHLDRQVDVLS